MAIGADGATLLAVGRPTDPVFPRSASKPMQAAGMLALGLPLHGELLALAAASHSGESFHLDGVRRILADAGLTVDHLQTPPDLPYDPAAARAWLRGGGGPEPLLMNCSGKHAAMLATCVVNGWDPAHYLDPSHPLQVALLATLEDLAAERVSATAVDGCGAPLWSLSLVGLARAFQASVLAAPGEPARRVADAMRAHPEWVGGTGRDVTDLMRGVPGLLAKDGAEGVYAVALPDGRAVALKIEDGADRARPVVMAAALGAVGVRADVVDRTAERPVLGGSRPVGAIRAVRLV